MSAPSRLAEFFREVGAVDGTPRERVQALAVDALARRRLLRSAHFRRLPFHLREALDLAIAVQGLTLAVMATKGESLTLHELDEYFEITAKLRVMVASKIEATRPKPRARVLSVLQRAASRAGEGASSRPPARAKRPENHSSRESTRPSKNSLAPKKSTARGRKKS